MLDGFPTPATACPPAARIAEARTEMSGAEMSLLRRSRRRHFPRRAGDSDARLRRRGVAGGKIWRREGAGAWRPRRRSALSRPRPLRLIYAALAPAIRRRRHAACVDRRGGPRAGGGSAAAVPPAARFMLYTMQFNCSVVGEYCTRRRRGILSSAMPSTFRDLTSEQGRVVSRRLIAWRRDLMISVT